MAIQKYYPKNEPIKSPTSRLLDEAMAAVRGYYAHHQEGSFFTFETLLERFILGLYLLINKIGLTLVTTEILSDLMRFWFHHVCKRVAVETFYTAMNEPEQLDMIRDLLADEESREIFDWMIRYRIALAFGSEAIAAAIFPLNAQSPPEEKSLAQTLRDGFLLKVYKIKGYAIKTHGEILQEIWDRETYALKERCELLPGEIVIDVGAFCGETAIWFGDKVGATGRVYTFEPSAKSRRILERNIHRNRMDSFIEIVPMALWDEDKPIFLNNLSAESQTNEKGGGQRIEATTLDSFVSSRRLERLDFIKMDIEGAELRALRGAEQTIKRFEPKLAICIYHLPSDIYEIPLLIKSMVPEYRLYISQKTTSSDGTVLFATVKGK